MFLKPVKIFVLVVVCAVVGLVDAKAASPDFLVSSEWLEERIDDPKVVVLEVRYHPHRYYTIGHIPGAVQVQRFKDLGDNQGSPLMKYPSREQFQATLRRWGVNDDSTLVLYDDSRTALASRLYYLLELYGFDMSRVKILNGGTTAWGAFNDLSTDHEPERQAGTVTLQDANPGLVVEWTDVYDRFVSQRDSSIVLLDARPHEHYTGEVKAHSVRAGHIPGAINIVSLSGTTETQTWKTLDELAAMYAPIPKDKTVYIYCHDGFRMSHAYLQLKALGYQDVRLYNGGWGHWGNNLELPIVTGEDAFDEAFML